MEASFTEDLFQMLSFACEHLHINTQTEKLEIVMVYMWVRNLNQVRDQQVSTHLPAALNRSGRWIIDAGSD